MSKIQEVTQALRNSISQVILGKEDVVDKLLAALRRDSVALLFFTAEWICVFAGTES